MAASTSWPDRERVVAVAAQLFARNGYQGTGVGDLAKAVGLARDELHHDVESKEALLYVITREQVDRLNAHAEAMLGAGHPPKDLLRELTYALLREIAGHGTEWAVFLRRHRSTRRTRRVAVPGGRSPGPPSERRDHRPLQVGGCSTRRSRRHEDVRLTPRSHRVRASVSPERVSSHPRRVASTVRASR